MATKARRNEGLPPPVRQIESEDDLLEFVAKVNSIYRVKLKKPAPFMTFTLCGMQSAGKSTIMERFLGVPLNIVQQGTGTRCPLDATCIHDIKLKEPRCDLSGEELNEASHGQGLSVEEAFERINKHNNDLKDSFSPKPLYLVFRSPTVHNMRFVDMPGIISNKGTGRDNRKDIKKILRSEMDKPNSKLCVLLEPTEYASNSIIEFCDNSFGEDKKWRSNAIFLMTKYDKQTNDTLSANNANTFFSDYLENGIAPYLVITKTLINGKVSPSQLYNDRRKLLLHADEHEKKTFDRWQKQHQTYRENSTETEQLNREIATRISFAEASEAMRAALLKDTLQRLPEVTSALKKEKMLLESKFESLKERVDLSDPSKVKPVANLMIKDITVRMKEYLDGDILFSMKFGGAKHQTLSEEVAEERDSDWIEKKLSYHVAKEAQWRDRVSVFTKKSPKEIQPDEAFLGGKQYQRAFCLFRSVMIDSLPDEKDIIKFVPTATGYLGGGHENENWENAALNIVKGCIRNVCPPGVDFLIKHIGHIFRRLFDAALDDVREGEEHSAEFNNAPDQLESTMRELFETRLWELMKQCADQLHQSLKPMYSSINTDLPAIHRSKQPKLIHDINVTKQSTTVSPDGTEDDESESSDMMSQKLPASGTDDGSNMKKHLRDEATESIHRKRKFLPDERASMITDTESSTVVRHSFNYLQDLVEYIFVMLKFQLNDHLYNEFKDKMLHKLVLEINDVDWEKRCRTVNDILLEEEMESIEEQIKSIDESLLEVQTMTNKSCRLKMK